MATARLSFKISVPIVLVSALALGLTVFLNVGKLERTLGEVEESRLRFSLNELRANLETGLDLGLSVTGLGNAQAALDAQTAEDKDIVSLSVIDTDGEVVFNSGPGPMQRYAAPDTVKGRDWQARDGDTITVGTKLVNDLGVTSGAVVLRYSMNKQNAILSAISGRLVAAAAVAVALTTLCFMFGIHALVRRMDRTLGSLEAGLGDAPDANADPYAAALVEQVNRSSKAALRDLDAAHQALAAGEAAR